MSIFVRYTNDPQVRLDYALLSISPGSFDLRQISSSVIEVGERGNGASIVRITGKDLRTDSSVITGGIIDRVDLVGSGGQIQESIYAINMPVNGFGQTGVAPYFLINGITYKDINGNVVFTFPGVSSGKDTVYGGDSNDELYGGGGDDTIYGYKGDDTIHGETGVFGTSPGGIDTIEPGIDTIYGGDGNDTISGGRGNDTIDGGAGDDVLVGLEWVPGGLVQSYVFVQGMDTITGGAGNDVIYAQVDDSSYNTGAAGPYRYQGGVVADGGDGIDYLTLNLSHIAGPLRLDWRDTSVTIKLSDGTSIRNIERLKVVTGDGDDVIHSGRYTDRIYTGAGNDTVHMGGVEQTGLASIDSHEIIDLGAGDDRLFVTRTDYVGALLDGGEGFDTLIIDLPSATTALDISPPTGFEALDARGGSGNDRMLGGTSASNTLTGNGGNDFLFGGAQGDTISGGSGDDELYGNGGNDVIDGGGGNDAVYAGDGDDRVIVNNPTGAYFRAEGGSGTDTLVASGDIANALIVGFEILGSNAGMSSLRITAEALNAFTRVEADRITLTTSGTVGANFAATAGAAGGELVGAAGNDTIELAHVTAAWSVDGSGGDDVIRAGSGADTLKGGAGTDRLSGGRGNDTLIDGDGADQLDGGAGNDKLFSQGSGAAILRGGADDDELSISGSGVAILDGGSGADTLTVQTSYDLTKTTITGIETLRASAGATITLTAAQLAGFTNVEATNLRLTTAGTVGAGFGGTGGTWYLAAGTNTVDLAHASAGFTIVGNTGSDTVTTGSGRDDLRGEGGNDTLDAGAGADTMRGGAGDDVYHVDNAGDVVVEAANGGTDTVYASADWSLGAGQAVELLAANGTRGITLKGNELSNHLFSGDAADRLEGGAGDDFYYVDAGDTVVETAGGGFDVIHAAGDYTLAEGSNVEGLGGQDDTPRRLTGNSSDNTFYGGAGADRLSGKGGDDIYVVGNLDTLVFEAAGEGYDEVRTQVDYYVLQAGQEIEKLSVDDPSGTGATALFGNEFANEIVGDAGANHLDGDRGADVLRGGAGNDTYLVDQTADRVIEAVGGGADTVVASVSYKLEAGQQIERLETIVATSTTRIDLTGNEFANILLGNAGSNVLDGGWGADAMGGGRGNDTYVVDNAADRVSEGAGSANGLDTIRASIAIKALAANVENLVLTGSAGLSGTGNGLANTLTGNNGANTLDGGLGKDVLFGGAGKDTFFFSTKPSASNLDHIRDFRAVDDTIKLERADFSALKAGKIKADEFAAISSKSAVVDGDAHLLYHKASGTLYYDPNGGSAAGRVAFVVLDNKAGLTFQDFLVA